MNPFFNMKDLQGFMEQLTESNFRGMPLNGFNIQKQVMDTVYKNLPEFIRQGQTSPLPANRADYQVFETHDFVIARISIPNNGNIQPKISMNTHTLYIKGLPDPKEDLTIPLPASIKPRHAKAEYRNGILEVRMVKLGPEPTAEITIDE